MLRETFISKAKAIHGDKYDYSLVDECVKTHGKVAIICPKHGVFEQEANSHMQGRGCEKCSYEFRGKKHRKNDFVERAKEIHGNKYDYSKTKYETSHKKVIIICPIHGEFQQLAGQHLKGRGCFKCGREITGKKKKKSQEDFINDAKSIHGNKFLYDKVNYLDSKIKVIITCPKHGDFLISPYNLLAGKGCKKCYYETISERVSLTQEEFVNRCKEIHGGKYDYSKSIYKGKDKKVLIICPIHGEFKQLAGHHMRGHGCPHCMRSLGEEEIANILNELKVDYIPQYRISNDNLFCKSKVLKVDFYLPKYGVFIEYNGAQHYKPIEHFGGESKFEQQKERDMALRQFCNERNIKLIEISYKEFGNIENIIKRTIKSKRK